jgi:hypothetical protein
MEMNCNASHMSHFTGANRKGPRTLYHLTRISVSSRTFTDYSSSGPCAGVQWVLERRHGLNDAAKGDGGEFEELPSTYLVLF